MTDIPLGTIGVTPTFGSNFDRFIARAIQWCTATRDQYSHSYHNSTVNHAVVYVGEMEGYDKPQLVQAQPGGADFADWDSYGDNMIWLTNINQWQKFPTGPTTTLARRVPLEPTDAQRAKIVEVAKSLAIKHIGYNYLDFVAIALAQQRFGNVVKYDKPSWWVKRLSNDNHMICSQLADYTWMKADLHLFADNRPAGLVSPADLAFLGVV